MKQHSYKTMTDAQLRRFRQTTIDIASISVGLFLGCLILGIWVDARWFLTSLVIVLIFKLAMAAGTFASLEQQERQGG